MKLPTCTGCLLPIESDQAIHKCLFSSKGFTLHSKPFTPCKVRYHSKCIKVGHPFATRHFGKGTKGLQYPPCATSLPFICELCTTRTQLGRELDALSPEDILLLKLERMRMIDVAHAWAPTTLQNACRSLRRTNNFFSSHNIPSLHQQLHLPALDHPPLDVSITIFWSMIHHTTFPSSRSHGAAPSWNTARSQRSTLSLYCAWTSAICSPHNTYKDRDNRLLSATLVSPSDNILSRLSASGISSRLGTESRPSQALTYAHIVWNQKYRKELLNNCSTLTQKYDLVAAQCAELLAWLGWLRASELFTIRRNDVELVPPTQGAVYGLPPNVGAVLFQLLPSTKSSRNKQVDIVVAWQTSSGLRLGYWLRYLFHIMDQLKWTSPQSFLFRSTSESTHWSSHYFRTNHLYPLLHLQYLQGDVTIRHIQPTTSHGIPYYFYSLHSYRRGAKTFPTRKRTGCRRAATRIELENHGRWRVKNTGREDMPLHYTEPSIEDRIYLTLLCY